jgi:tetratricopeptide (TPR) repeat protein/transglutaminase-like putative cysteine protease
LKKDKILSLCFLFWMLLILGNLTSGADSQSPWNVAHFTIPAKDLYALASAVPAPAEAHITFLDDEEVFSYDAGGRIRYIQYVVCKVQTERGSTENNSLSVLWEPWHQERPVIKARVIGPDFSVHDLDVSTIADAPVQDADNNVYSDRKMLRAPLPAVSPGSVIEEEIEIRDREPAFSSSRVARGFFGRNGAPVQHSRMTIEVPSGTPLRYKTFLLPDVHIQRTENEGRIRVLFDQEAMEGLEDQEQYLPSDVPVTPYITFSTGTSWQQLASEYSSVVLSRIASDDVTQIVRQLMKSAHTRQERADAIISYVNKQVRYTGIEFGSAAVIPHTPAETLARRYGDCKDKSALVVSMLRAAGIPAYMALLRVGGRMDVQEDLPGFGLFDHAIVYAPGAPDYWIDATDDYARLGELPIGDQGRRVLVIRPETMTLISTPEATSSENLLSEYRDFHMQSYGLTQVVERSQPHGGIESSYRRSYADQNDKNLRESLKNYMKNQYLATDLDRMERTDPSDFSRQFELTLVSKKSKRGFTDLVIAVAAIRLEGLFSRLPTELQQKPAPEEKDSSHKKPKAPRTADYLLPQTFITEWNYAIAPPTGFQVKTLPHDIHQPLGPCVFSAEFHPTPDHVVHATLRFDTVKRRLTVAETNELRSSIAALLQQPPLLVYFEPKGQALIDEGKIRDGVHAYREMIANSPSDPLPHLRMAIALLATGLASAARDEARIAVQLDPTSAIAQKTLAEILEHDLVGRKYRPGSDYDGAEAAYRAAIKLDPEDHATIGNLAILLEHNKWGLHYGPGARLLDAVTEYKKLTDEQAAELGISANVAFSLFYASHFAEAKSAALRLNSPLTALQTASEAALNGAPAGLAEARKLSTGEDGFKEIARTAADMLENIGQYALAADLKEAGASGNDASALQSEAALLRKTKRHQDIVFADGPIDAALRFELLTDDPDLKIDDLRAISSKNGAPILAVTEVRDYFAGEQRKTMSGKAMKGIFYDVGTDLSITRAQPTIQGNDKTGYKVTLWPSASYKNSIYVVKEDGHYKILGTSWYVAGIGLEVLDRVDAEDLPGARQLLDWMREDRRLSGGDDPLGGEAFPRFWVKGKMGDAVQIKSAAAALLIMNDATAARGIAVLEKAQSALVTEQEKTRIAIALIHGYIRLDQYDKSLVLEKELYAQYPESEAAFLWHSWSLLASGHVKEAAEFTNTRLESIPGDPVAIRRLANIKVHQGDYSTAVALLLQVVKSGKGNDNDLNSVAWEALFTGQVSDTDLEIALKAAELSNKNANVLHTLACIYTELGKLKEAREVLLQAMDSARMDEPTSPYWYAWGRIAEQAGEYATARAFYQKVTKPKNPMELPIDVYVLAQKRLEHMQKAKQ